LKKALTRPSEAGAGSANQLSNAGPKRLQTRQPPKKGVKPSKSPTASKPALSAPVSQALLTALLAQEEGTSLDTALSKALKTARDLEPPDRRKVVQSLTELNRRRARLSWHLSEERSRISPHHLLLAFAALETGGEVKGLRYSDNDLALAQKLARRTLDDPRMPEASRLECPKAFEAVLREALGQDFERELQASLEPAPVDLRVNLLKTTVEDARKRLRNEDVKARPMPFSPWGLRCDPGANVSATKTFQDGLVEFQDEGSQLAALLCDAKPGMQVMDFCAGTGGKTLALAAAMQNKGHLVACDISKVRMARAKLRLKRAGAENAERKELPAADDKWMKKHYARFDRVLVDAPCSGTGSWRRNPDARWSTQAAKLDELTALQDSVVSRASNFVKPGGHLVYATCSLLTQENDARVAQFLKAHKDFERLDARALFPAGRDWPCGEEQVLRLSPARHGTDGFFAAVLRRVTIPA
jgi:16S rRNA (cytosine967-C5)-methyltransferase